jgi:penicillin-binding protein 2
MIGREDEVRGYRDRAFFFYYAVVGALLIIVFRLFFLQVIKGDDLRKFSEANRLKKEKVLPTRGIIFDREGHVIVDNRAAFDVVMLTQYYPFTPEMNLRLAKALQMKPEDLEKKLAKAKRGPSYYPLLLKADVSKDVIAAVEMDAEGFPGVDVEATVQRRYPFKDMAAQLLGYISEVDTKDVQRDPGKKLEPGDYIGRMGLERQYDAYLRGIDGVGYVEVDARGRRKKTEGEEKLLGFVAQTEPFPGNNMYLTLDMDVQLAAVNTLKTHNYSGSIVALDPRNGEILAWVNAPSFEPEVISGRELDPKIWAELSTNPDRPLRNRAMQDIYPPGSTFKMFLAIAALSEGIATPKTSFHCSGGMQFGNRRFHCWKTHGSTELVKAIRESCDVFFYNIGNLLGVDKIAYYAREFGLGSRTGIKLANEQGGLIPDSEWKVKRFKDIWHPGETLSVSIGQGYVSVTPLQLANAYAAIGNEGFLYRPQLIRRIEGRGGELIKEFQPELIRKVNVPSEVFGPVKEGLFQVANMPGGTAIVSAHSKFVGISGKTGTAQVRAFAEMMKVKCEKLPREHRHHGWFVGYAPKENPQIAVVALAEHSCHGTAGAPLVRDVIEAYLKKQAKKEGRELVEEKIKRIPQKAPASIIERDE